MLLVRHGKQGLDFMASRVLMVGPSPEAWGGVATVEKNILDAVASTGREVHFVATMRDGSKFTKILMFPQAFSRFVVNSDNAMFATSTLRLA